MLSQTSPSSQQSFAKGFSLSGCSLKLLDIGERAVVSRLKSSDETVLQRLKMLGLVPGKPISIVQRFPRFIVKTVGDRIALDERSVQAIYVRITD